MIVTAWRAYRAAIAEAADLYHFHDPELLPWALFLKVRGRRVIYDVHEDVPGAVAYKTYVPNALRPLVAAMVGALESLCARWYDAIVAATPHLGELCARFGQPVIVVQNFPRLEELALGQGARPYGARAPHIGYVGGISVPRGVRGMLEAVQGLAGFPDAVLHLGGPWYPPELRLQLARDPGLDRVVEHGRIGRAELVDMLSGCRVGVVVSLPEQNYVLSYATKMFEYMAMGLPVVASDFHLWRRIVEGAGCGLLVDPMDTVAIRDAIAWLLGHPEEAEAMGARGKEAVLSRYNWDQEKLKLIELYRKLVPPGGATEKARPVELGAGV